MATLLLLVLLLGTGVTFFSWFVLTRSFLVLSRLVGAHGHLHMHDANCAEWDRAYGVPAGAQKASLRGRDIFVRFYMSCFCGRFSSFGVSVLSGSGCGRCLSPVLGKPRSSGDAGGCPASPGPGFGILLVSPAGSRLSGSVSGVCFVMLNSSVSGAKAVQSACPASDIKKPRG